MKYEPRNLQDLVEYVEEVVVIDLLSHAMSLDEVLRDALNEPTEGLYLVGSIEPIMVTGNIYYPKSQYYKPEGVINDFNKVKTIKEEIVNSKMETVLSVKDLATKSKFFRMEPTVPVMAMKAAIGIVEQYLTSVCRHSRRTHPTYRLEYLVKQENRSLVDNDEYARAFKKLLDQVMDFIKEDNWALYFTRVKGSSLVIEKGVDYRIFTYYENIFKTQEEKAE